MTGWNDDYPSGAASLFAGHARQAPARRQLFRPVPCPHCLSDETELVETHMILVEGSPVSYYRYRCLVCGEVFERSVGHGD